MGIEVTTTNPAQDVPVDVTRPLELLPKDMDDADREFVFQVGMALRRKVLHRDAQGQAYWEKPHVTGIPFVIAVGAFHGRHAQVHPVGLLGDYLYGSRGVPQYDEAGRLTMIPEEIAHHRFGTKTIPSGLFRQPETADLAGVLFSNAHTVAMFNRIGNEQGLGLPDTALTRFGTCYDHDPNASKPQFFAYVVGDRPPGAQETFTEGLQLFINPWATRPLSPETLPGVTTHQLLSDGNVKASFSAAFQPFVSKTVVFHQEHAEALARYMQLQLLGRLPPGAPGLGRQARRSGGSSNTP